ncbi:MAG: DJ-1 family glyoxalase III [Candidatus Omnitrophota bacterium]|jgi:4-methyl-5(b-hydroxyethyl)-thiazole monophosphate biosynthesis
MKKILVPLAGGFEEIEAVTVIDVLRRAGFRVETASLDAKTVAGAHGLSVVADLTLEDALKADYDALVLPGGQPGTDHLRKDNRVLGLVRKMRDGGKWVAAICAAPLVLRDAGIADGLELTSYPGLEGEFSASRYRADSVVVDGTVVTGRGPGVAMVFALKLVELIAGPAEKDRLSCQMVCPPVKS